MDGKALKLIGMSTSKCASRGQLSCEAATHHKAQPRFAAHIDPESLLVLPTPSDELSHDNMLTEWCSTCRNLDFHCPLPWPTERWSFPSSGHPRRDVVFAFQSTPSEVESSASSGCLICAVVYEAVLFFWEPAEVPNPTLSIRTWAQRNPEVCLDVLPLTFVQLYTPVGKYFKATNIDRTCCVDLHIGLKPAFHQVPVVSEISEAPWNSITRSFLHENLDRCSQDHPLCAKSISQPRLPTRLLQLDEDGDSFRLINTRLSMKVQYTALSYCWGSYKSLKTTTSNISNMKAGVQVSKLPKSLQDAIQITHEIGLQYIWIDALCIVQDQLEDWEKESANMASIYENAYLTIAASSSSSSRKGFLHGKREILPTFSMPLLDEDGGYTKIQARFLPHSGIHSRNSPATVDPWARRGWTFQEEKLSTRIILFSTTEVQWVCRSQVVCECKCLETFNDMLLSSTLLELACKEDAFMWWQEHLLPNYTHRSLTCQGDALPALSGIAKVIQRITKSEYVAGMWRENLLLDLLWHKIPGMREFETPSRVVKHGGEAPSFSWASVTGEIHYEWSDFYQGKDDTKKWSFATKVLDINAEATGRNPYGRVENAWLKLRGPLVPGQLYGRPDDVTGEQVTYNFAIEDIDLEVKDDYWVEVFKYEENGMTMLSPRRRTSPPEFPPRRCSARLRPDLLNSEFGQFGILPDMIRGQIPGAEQKSSIDGSSTFDSVKAWALYIGSFPIPRFEGESDFDEDTEESHSEGVLQSFLVLGRSPRNPAMYSRVGLIEVQHRAQSDMLVFGDELMQSVTII